MPIDLLPSSGHVAFHSWSLRDVTAYITITIKHETLRSLHHDIWGTVSVFIFDLNADIGGGFINLTAGWPQCRYKRRFYKSHSRLSKIMTGNRCRNIRTMQNVTNRNLIDPNKSANRCDVGPLAIQQLHRSIGHDRCKLTWTCSDWEEIFANGPFSAFFNDFDIFNGPFLIILHGLLWAIFQVNWTMVHGPLPSRSLTCERFPICDD